jgi:hypothetical protein
MIWQADSIIIQHPALHIPTLALVLAEAPLRMKKHYLIPLAGLALVSSSVAQSPASLHAGLEKKSTWTWQRVEGESLALNGPQGLLWRLNFGPDLAKPFFDPLTTPGGGSLTWVAPPDHVWHYGLWFSWKTINGVNYWETNPATGKPDGTTRLTGTRILRTDDSGAELVFDFVFHPAAGGDPVMKESVRLSIETPRPDGTYRIDWHQRTTATGPVVLDRTPLPDQPGGKPYGGYGGLSFRAAKDLGEVLMLDSEGRRGMDVHRRRATWLDTSGIVAGKPAGVTFFDHPANPRHPTTWYVALSQLKVGPFTYMNPALLHDEPIKLGAGESLALRYRILVHPGAANPPALDAEFKSFSRLPEPSPLTPDS